MKLKSHNRDFFFISVYNVTVGDIMKSIIVDLQCPSCMWHSQIMSDTLILSEFETDLKAQLKEGHYFHTICPRCQTKIGYFHTCVYTDRQHGFVLLMKPRKEIKDADHLLYRKDAYIKRYLFSEDEIAEKMAILEADLDDRVIEILKVKLYLQAKKTKRLIMDIHFYDYDVKSESIWFCVERQDTKDLLAVTLESYQTIQKTLTPMKTDGFYAVDLEWAIAYLKTKQNTR